MNHILGIGRKTIVHDDAAKSREHPIDLLIELTDAEFEQYERAYTPISRFSRDSELFIVVLRNYQSFYDALNGQLQSFIQRLDNSFTPRSAYMEINRHLMNWLSSVRTFLDHLEATIKRHYGEDTTWWRDVRQACEQEYDGNFSYRFLYRLRNYAQHAGLPADSVDFSTFGSHGDPSKPQNKLIVACSRESLLKVPDVWGATLRVELAQLPEEIEISPHVDSMMRSLERVNLAFMRGGFMTLRASAEHVRDLFDRLPDTDDARCLFDVDYVYDDAGKIQSMSRIVIRPTDLAFVAAIANNRVEDATGRFEVRGL